MAFTYNSIISPPGKRLTISYIQHMILVHTNEQVVQTERVLDGRRQREQLRDGNIIIVPATVSHQVNWDRK